MDVFNVFFDLLYSWLVIPVLYWVDTSLRFLISPVSNFTPRTQIIVVSVFGAIISRVLARRFRAKREKQLQEEFKENISSLKYTKHVDDKTLGKVIRKGINEEADKIYEKILLDKFSEMGISYFFPLFSLLIWLEYSLFTPENLKLLIGSSYAWVTASGLKFSAAWVYLYSYNIILFGLWILGGMIRPIIKSLKTTRHPVLRSTAL
jgi:hypothetical protein